MSRRPSRSTRYAIPAIVLGAAVLVALVREAGPDGPAAGRFDLDALATPGFGEVRFRSVGGHALRALVYRSSAFDARHGPILFVLHGASREVERYVQAAAPVAERHAALAIAIHFSRQRYPRSSDYTLGLTTISPPDRAAWTEQDWLDPESYLHIEIEHAFDAVRGTLGGRQQGYYLFGHSAGAQFVHRLMTFVGEARVLGAVAANAGWYTLPSSGAGPDLAMPYGLGGTPLGPRDLERFFAARFTVLLGERDTSTPAADALVRGTAEAMAQGPHRLARGRHYFAVAEAEARALALPFAWRLAVVPRAGHDAAEMIGSAAFFLFGPDEPPCAPTATRDAALALTEILADPPRGARGDANGDGNRDPSDDEFAPGEAVAVFGGGVPSGDFGGARVEPAAFGRLSLQNAGDIVTLRDAAGAVAAELSWGDCAGNACASEHFGGDLGAAASITRSSDDPAGSWRLHGASAGTPFSPGVRADGSAWPLYQE